MSQLVPSVVTCPRCEATWSMALFSSVDADTIQPQVDAILDDTFERQTCAGCGHTFRPEHPLLFASHARRLWIVMQPLTDRTQFATIERGVERVLADNFAAAAPVLADRLRGIRPRLVFGQHMLTEAVRASYAGLDAGLLECAKLLTVRRNLPRLMAHGPFELCFERFGDSDAPICAVHTLPAGDRVDELALPADAFAEAQASRAALRERFPDLFERPYVSATRYLLAATV
jgi:rubredoxin